MGNNKLKIAIMQPTFNPWIGYFDLIDYVDKFIFLDTVQLTKRSWQTRNKFLLNSNEVMFSIPIQKTSSRDDLLIKDALISYENFDFREKFAILLEQGYKKSLFYKEIHRFIQDLIFFDTSSLSLYNINIIENISKKLGITTEFHKLSEINFTSDSKKGNLILDICEFFNTEIYVSPLGAYEYMEKSKNLFTEQNRTVQYQHYLHPIYTQLGKTFIPYIGILDLLYNNGFHNSLEIIKTGRNYEN